MLHMATTYLYLQIVLLAYLGRYYGATYMRRCWNKWLDCLLVLARKNGRHLWAASRLQAKHCSALEARE
jgi:hypothetical protein